MNNFTYGKDGTKLTQSFEGCELTAYRDSKGVLTIGWGHTGSDVQDGLTITLDEAKVLFAHDILWAQAEVNRQVIVPISQEENDALVDLVFNIGRAAFDGSTLLRELNAGNIAAAAAEFDKWDRCGGQILAGLLRRRQAETALFEQGAQPPTAA